jgi:peptidyl-prolyl cis-trans isomerase D
MFQVEPSVRLIYNEKFAECQGTRGRLNSMDKKNTGVRILLGIIVGILGIGMLLYLVPQGNSDVTNDNNVVASVAGNPITREEVSRELSRMQASGQMPAFLMQRYTLQIIDQLVSKRMMDLEAERLGMSVTEPEVFDRIKSILPTAYENGTFVGQDAYTLQVQMRFQMTVDEFEELVRDSMLLEKVQALVTSGVTATPDEVRAEFRRKNEKIKMDYVLVHPDSLESQIQASDAELGAYYEKNKTKYMIPEQRVVRYLLIDPGQLEAKVTLPESELQSYYNSHIDTYRVEDRVQISRILFKTTGKTDAEMTEIRKKADDVLKQAKNGGKFEELVKKYSEDDSKIKDKGGDLGWIVHNQAPELEKAAFSLGKGEVSDVITTQLGLCILKITDKEQGRTKSLAEVMPMIQTTLATQKAQAMADDLGLKIGDQLRQTGRPTLDALAKQYSLPSGETRPLGVTDSAPELGNAPDIKDSIFRMRMGDISQPIRTDHGFVVLSVKNILPAHQGTLAEVHDKLVTDYRREKSVDLAKQRAADLAKRAQGGEDFSKAAKALSLDVKTSDLVARDGSVTGAGTARQFLAAFDVPVGKTGDPVSIGADWLVYKVDDHQQPNMDDFEKQKKDIEDQLLNSKRQLAFESFRSALEADMRRQGKLTYNQDVVKQLTRPT